MNPEIGISLYALAAEQGDIEAKYHLGVLYDNGQGIDPDPDEAVKLFTEAAEAGDARALNALGVMYASGRSVKADRIKAYMLYHLAVNRGDDVAKTNMATLGFTMSRAQVKQALLMAEHWKPGQPLP